MKLILRVEVFKNLVYLVSPGYWPLSPISDCELSLTQPFLFTKMPLWPEL